MQNNNQNKNYKSPRKQFGLNRNLLIIFALVFGALGSYVVWQTFAAPAPSQVENFEVSGELEVLVSMADDQGDTEDEQLVTEDQNSHNNKHKSPHFMNAIYEYNLKAADGQRYKLVFPDDPANPRAKNKGPGLLGGSKVKIKGKKSADNTIVMASSGGEDVVTVSAVTVPEALETRKVAIILFNFSDDTSQPMTPDEAKQEVFGSSENSVKSFLKRNSYGKFDIKGNIQPEGDVFGWVTINNAKAAGCYENLWADAADKAVAETGIDLSVYQHKIYSFPQASCGWGGKAYLPGSRSFNNIRISSNVATHEFGHNLGLTHANGYRCKDQYNFYTDMSSTCQSLEYYDDFDVMGNSNTSYTQDLSAYHKLQLGWLPKANMQQISASGEYTITPIEKTADGTQVLLVPRATWRKIGVLDYYYLEYRPHTEANSVQPPGALVRYGKIYDDLGFNNSNLIDTTPETIYGNNFSDAPLAIGRTFTDSVNGVTITPVSATPDQLKVKVTLGSNRTSSPDNATCVSNVGPVGVTPNGPNFNATITMKNTGTSTWKAGDYELGSISNPTGVWGKNNLALNVDTPPGGTAVFSSSFVPPSSSRADPRGFNWRMFKKSTSEWFGQPCIKAMAVDNYPTAPTVPANLTSGLVNSSSVALQWTPSIEGTGFKALRYKILRASGSTTYLVSLPTASNGTYTDTSVKPGSTYSYTVVAINRNGLESAPSQAVTVKVPRR